MNKFLTAIFAIIFTLTAYAEIEPVGRSSVLKYDGTVDANSLEQRFVNVLNKAGQTISAGMAVVLDTSNDDGASVTISATAGLKPMCLMVAACSSNKLCKCQTYGYAAAALFDVTAASATAGKRFYLSSVNAGYIAARAADAASEVPGGIFYDAASASASVEVFIDL